MCTAGHLVVVSGPAPTALYAALSGAATARENVTPRNATTKSICGGEERCDGLVVRETMRWSYTASWPHRRCTSVPRWCACEEDSKGITWECVAVVRLVGGGLGFIDAYSPLLLFAYRVGISHADYIARFHSRSAQPDCGVHDCGVQVLPAHAHASRLRED